MNTLDWAEELLCHLLEWDERLKYYRQVPTSILDSMNELLMHLHELTEEWSKIQAENISEIIRLKDIFISSFIEYEVIEFDDVGDKYHSRDDIQEVRSLPSGPGRWQTSALLRLRRKGLWPLGWFTNYWKSFTPISALVKSLHPASDSVPDTDTHQSPGRAPTIDPHLVPIPTLDPVPDSNSNKNILQGVLEDGVEKTTTNQLLWYLEEFLNHARLTLIKQSVANMFWEHLKNSGGS